MAEFVLDASVAISWCFPGDPMENTPYSRRVLEALVVHDAIVPEIWAFEIANNIFVSHNRRKRINEQQVEEYLTLLKALPIRVASQPLWSNVELEAFARRWDIAPTMPLIWPWLSNMVCRSPQPMLFSKKGQRPQACWSSHEREWLTRAAGVGDVWRAFHVS